MSSRVKQLIDIENCGDEDRAEELRILHEAERFKQATSSSRKAISTIKKPKVTRENHSPSH